MFEQQYGVTDKLDRIEDKILERGTFTKIFGTDYSLSTRIDEDSNDSDYGPCFDLIIEIISNKKTFKDDDIEKVADYVGDTLLELVKNEVGDEGFDEVSSALRETQVFVNEKRIY